jgi:hypothetical protein
VWYAHKAYRRAKKEEKEARRDLEAAVANATELTDVSAPLSPPAAAASASPLLSPLVLPASVVALFKR